VETEGPAQAMCACEVLSIFQKKFLLPWSDRN